MSKKSEETVVPKPDSLREFILDFDDINEEIVTVPEWGNVQLKVVGMSGKERSRMLRRSMNNNNEVDLEKMYPLLVVATVRDPESNEPVFTENDLDALNDKSGAALERVGKVASRLSGMEREAVNEMGKDSS